MHSHSKQFETTMEKSKRARGGENMMQKKKHKKPRERESCQWKWAVLQEASGWACENHISLFSEHWKKMPPSLSLLPFKGTRSQANF